MKARKATIHRATRETDITLSLNLDGTGRVAVDTGLPFLDHMLELFAKHGLLDLTIRARGDLAVDYHHTVEDLGLTLGEALDRALGGRAGIVRCGHAYVPMDDALARAVVDLGGRPYLVWEFDTRARKIMAFDLALLREFALALTVKGRLNLHVAQFYGRDPHHAYEAAFKAMGRALAAAARRDPRVKGVPSSKGTL